MTTPETKIVVVDHAPYAGAISGLLKFYGVNAESIGTNSQTSEAIYNDVISTEPSVVIIADTGIKSETDQRDRSGVNLARKLMQNGKPVILLASPHQLGEDTEGIQTTPRETDVKVMLQIAMSMLGLE
jgi:archaellum biogenesis ATPase FlaH